MEKGKLKVGLEHGENPLGPAAMPEMNGRGGPGVSPPLDTSPRTLRAVIQKQPPPEASTSPRNARAPQSSQQERVRNGEREGMQEGTGQWINKLCTADCHGSFSWSYPPQLQHSDFKKKTSAKIICGTYTNPRAFCEETALFSQEYSFSLCKRICSGQIPLQIFCGEGPEISPSEGEPISYLHQNFFLYG